jgi:hypothetical protein
LKCCSLEPQRRSPEHETGKTPLCANVGVAGGWLAGWHDEMTALSATTMRCNLGSKDVVVFARTFCRMTTPLCNITTNIDDHKRTSSLQAHRLNATRIPSPVSIKDTDAMEHCHRSYRTSTLSDPPGALARRQPRFRAHSRACFVPAWNHSLPVTTPPI